jgi:hypothetical protein
VSDASQGPGWWLASDDRWYPPELHPDAIAAREAAAAAAAPASPAGEAAAGEGAAPSPEAGAAGTAGAAAAGTAGTAAAGTAGAGAAGTAAGGRAPAWSVRQASPVDGAQVTAHQQSGWWGPAGSDAYSFGGHSRRRLPGRAVLIVSLAALALAGMGVAAYFLFFRSGNTTAPAGTAGPSASLGQSETGAGRGTTLTMTVTRMLDPAPGVSGVGVSQTPVAFLVTISNSGAVAYNLRNLAFGVSQGSTSSGGTGLTTSAGRPFRQAGTLAAGGTESGWVTGVAVPNAGPVTSFNVAFNAGSATGPSTTVSRDWKTG